MNFFVNNALLDDVSGALACSKKEAMKELLRQSRRLFTAYSSNPIKHAKYFNKVDAAALYALAYNKQLPKKELDVALKDLERIEELVAKLTDRDRAVYEDFVYFVEAIVRTCKSKDDLMARIDDFTADYVPAQLSLLAEYLRTAIGKPVAEFDKSLHDVVRRVHGQMSGDARAKMVNRIALAAELLDSLFAQRKEPVQAPPQTAEPAPQPETESQASAGQPQPAAEPGPPAAETTGPERKRRRRRVRRPSETKHV